MAAPKEQSVTEQLGRLYAERLEMERKLDALKKKKHEWSKSWAEAIGEAEKKLAALDADARAVATGSLLPGLDIAATRAS